jgi:rhomboid protease GluP
LIVLPADPHQAVVIVFRGSQPACREFSLVLDAKGLPYECVESDAQWALLVALENAEVAREELARYAQERSTRREKVPAIVPFKGAATGAIGYTLILLTVAFCAGINLFGADWMSIGALDQSAGAGRDWWRALTALTLHVNRVHLISNLVSGIVFGTLASSVFGPGVARASIVAAAALANYLEMLIIPPPYTSVGASTAVFAALGLLSGFALRRQLTLRGRWWYRWAPLIAGVILLSLLGAGTEHVDVLGHVLGFLAGVVFGWTCARAGLPRSRDTLVQVAAAIAAVSLLLVAWIMALRQVL